MEITRICNKCGAVNTLDAQSIKKIDCYTENGKFRRVLYFTCNICDNQAYLQIDNQYTLYLVDKCRRLLGTKGKTFVKTVKELKRKRKSLLKQSIGKNFYDKDKNILIKGLTFLGGDDII